MTPAEKLAAYEAMQQFVQQRYDDAVARMAQLKAQGREKSATYRQMMGDKLQFQNVLSLYKIYGLDNPDGKDAP